MSSKTSWPISHDAQEGESDPSRIFISMVAVLFGGLSWTDWAFGTGHYGVGVVVGVFLFMYLRFMFFARRKLER